MMQRRCRHSPEGIRWLRPKNPDRLGVCIRDGEGKWGPHRVVVWDGTKTGISYAARYIEFVDERSDH